MLLSEASLYFDEFSSDLNLTDRQVESVDKSRDRIIDAQSSPNISLIYQKPSFYTGSYSRDTIIRPLDDIDLYVRINYQKHAENRSPRQVIYYFMQALRKTFPFTPLKANSPCIEVEFSDKRFEVVPVVSYRDNDDLYDIPANNFGTWEQCYPNLPNRWITRANKRHGGLFVPLIKMIKQWIRNNSLRKPIKSFHIELLTDIVFSGQEIESYPAGIYYWFNVVHNLFLFNKSPFILEPEGDGYVDTYLYGKPFLLHAFKIKIEKGLRLTEKAVNYWIQGKEPMSILTFKNLFGAVSK